MLAVLLSILAIGVGLWGARSQRAPAMLANWYRYSVKVLSFGKVRYRPVFDDSTWARITSFMGYFVAVVGGVSLVIALLR